MKRTAAQKDCFLGCDWCNVWKVAEICMTLPLHRTSAIFVPFFVRKLMIMVRVTQK